MTRSRLYSRVSAIRAVGLAFVASAVITVAVVGTRPAEAAFPGENGRITFSSNRDGDSEIFTVRPDGTGEKQLTKNGLDDFAPSFSPDGKKIVFERDVLLSDGSRDREIFVMNADSGEIRRLTFSSGFDSEPTFSADGKKIAFNSDRDEVADEIYVMNADGTGVKRLTFNRDPDLSPVFSPNGQKIAFVRFENNNLEIFAMNSDGSKQTNLTNNEAFDLRPNFSPDGKRIVFDSDRDGDSEIFVMEANGSNQTSLTNNLVRDTEPVVTPDGRKIAFNSVLGIHTMNPNGSGAKLLTDPTIGGLSDWQANTAPTVTNLQPSPGSTTRDRTPTIRATAKDLQTDLAKANVRLTVDGKAVAETKFSYNPSTDRLAFTPERELPAGRHTVKVAAKDDVLLVGQSSWSFKVTTS
jgi:Tol biopolymer transport system component